MRSEKSARSRKRRRNKIKTHPYEMFVINVSKGENYSNILHNKKRDAFRFIVVEPGETYSVKAVIKQDAWDSDENPFNWCHVTLEVDGKILSTRYLQKPYSVDFPERCRESDSGSIQWTFEETNDTKQSFQFGKRHDERGSNEFHDDLEKDVGVIKITFRRARSKNVQRYSHWGGRRKRQKMTDSWTESQKKKHEHLRKRETFKRQNNFREKQRSASIARPNTGRSDRL